MRLSAKKPTCYFPPSCCSLTHPLQKTFNHDEVQGVVSESVETVLGTATYSHSKVGARCSVCHAAVLFTVLTVKQVGLWQATIVENVRARTIIYHERAYARLQVLKKLAHFNRPFKYIGTTPFAFSFLRPFIDFAVTCMVAQNTGSSTHTAHTYVSCCSGSKHSQYICPHTARCFWDTETDGIVLDMQNTVPFAF